MKLKTTLAIICITSSPFLSGCVTTLVGGMQENHIVVTVDEDSFSPSARNTLQRAKTLGVVPIDRSSIKAADLFETRGGYIVKIDRETAKAGEMTGSERRDALNRLCKSQHPDVALMARVVKTESGSTMNGVITGRVKVEQGWVMEMLACRTGAFDAFGGQLNMDVGIYNQKSNAEMQDRIGAEIAEKLLASIGNRKTGQLEIGDTNSTHLSQAAGSQVAKESSSNVQPVTILPPMSIMEIQKRLLALGYPVGAANGTMGKKTINALKKFQQDNKLPKTGKADAETMAKLRQP